jgi:hypothetical protein
MWAQPNRRLLTEPMSAQKTSRVGRGGDSCVGALSSAGLNVASQPARGPQCPWGPGTPGNDVT